MKIAVVIDRWSLFGSAGKLSVDNVVVVCIHPSVISNNPPEILNIIDNNLAVFLFEI
jgi:hypothetical protein